MAIHIAYWAKEIKEAWMSAVVLIGFKIKSNN